MSIPVCRIGDVFQAICYCHKHPISVTGVIVSGSPNVLANGSPVSRIGDIGIASCGHSCVIVSGDSTVVTSGSPTARIGDAVAGCPIGVIVSGSPNVLG